MLLSKTFKALKLLLLGDPLQNAEDKLQDAEVTLARHTAEANYYAQLATYNRKRAHNIDPYKDWNGFAKYMQKNADYMADYTIQTNKMRDASAIMEARRNQVAELGGGVIDMTVDPGSVREESPILQR